MLDYYEHILNDIEICSEKHENEFDFFVDKINEFYSYDFERMLFNIEKDNINLDDLSDEKIYVYRNPMNFIISEIKQLARNLEIDLDEYENYELLKLLEVDFDENFKNDVLLSLL